MELASYEESPFEEIRQVADDGQEFWSARDLMPYLGYLEWRNFADAITRAKMTCSNSGQSVTSNFGDATKITGTRHATDFYLSRYACYLVAMNGDPRKPEVAAAQTYFAVKTREAELVQQQIPETYAEALRAAAHENEMRVIAETKVEALAPRALSAESAEERKGGQTIADLRHEIMPALGVTWRNTMKAVALAGAITPRASGYTVGRGWDDLLINTMYELEGKEYASGTVRIRPGKQIEFMTRLKRAYAAALSA
ncbi:BRO family protein [Nocardia sp. NPDC055002]